MGQEPPHFSQSFPRLRFLVKCLAIAAGISAILLLSVGGLLPASEFTTRIMVVVGFSLVLIIGCTAVAVMVVAELQWFVKQRGMRRSEMEKLPHTSTF